MDQGAVEPKKRGRGRTRGAGPALLPCSVCGDMAPAHMHYGGVACFSCRAFFRRSVDKAYLYECQEGVSLIIIEQFSFPGRSIKGPIFGPRPSLAIVDPGRYQLDLRSDNPLLLPCSVFCIRDNYNEKEDPNSNFPPKLLSTRLSTG